MIDLVVAFVLFLFMIVLVCFFVAKFNKHLTEKRTYEKLRFTQNRKVVWDSVRKLAYDIPKRHWARCKLLS